MSTGNPTIGVEMGVGGKARVFRSVKEPHSPRKTAGRVLGRERDGYKNGYSPQNQEA